MPSSSDKPLPAVGVYWIEEADYPAALGLFEDGSTLPRTNIAHGPSRARSGNTFMEVNA